MMHFYKVVATLFLSLFISQEAFAKWDEERDMTTNGKEELVYYYKTNEQGQKLVLDKYVKHLILYVLTDSISVPSSRSRLMVL
uniref:Uncharacterized protein n=1 Tax=Polynucleobacter necessarius subsp. necessarius (strain STIR1) TaxID=452638 RepID=B1XRZ8_POLNS